MMIRVSTEDFDPAIVMRQISDGRTDIGALVSFVGLCRDMGEGAHLASLIIEAYREMAEEELRRLAEKARARFELIDVAIHHRYGTLLPGENIVLVVTAAAHRKAAFEAAEFLMDYLKTSAPFWKIEQKRCAENTSPDKDPSSGERRWVEARSGDAEALRRWIDRTP